MFSNPTLTSTFTAEGTIEPHRIVKPGSADFGVVAATAATDLLLGVTTEVQATNGERCDVILNGIAQVKLGSGGIVRGQPITAGANGVGVYANPSAGTVNQVIGYALISGSEHDIVPVLLSRSQKTTPAAG